MTTYGFIFARGGSKGLPGKNIKKLSGKPLIQYSIDVAKKCKAIDKVFVSTDDANIAKVAEYCGAEVINRPAELATDTADEWSAWRHAIECVTQKYGEFEGFISIPATSPLRKLQDIENAIEKLNDSKADICIGLTPSSRSPYFNMVKLGLNGYLTLVNELNEKITRRQDVPKVYDITTVVYATTTDFVLNNHGIFSGNVTHIEIPKERAIDIDDAYDFNFAEFLLNDQR